MKTPSRWITLCLIAGVAIAPTIISAAEAPSAVTVGRALRADTSPPLREMARTYFPVSPEAPTAEVPMGVVDRSERVAPEAGPDPVRQSLEQPLGPTGDPTPSPDQNWFTLSDDDNQAVLGGRIVPPDTVGDIGTDYYFQWVNSILAVYDKTDMSANPTPVLGPVAGNSIFTGFGGACETTNNGDPIVLYDQFSNQWQISQFAINQGIQCIAVSVTGDPTGSWHRFAFLVTPGGGNDYPKLGIMPTGYTATFRDFDPSFNISLVVFEREKMIVGDASAAFVKFALPCSGTDCIDGVLPVDIDGAVPRGLPATGTQTYWFFGANDEGYDSIGLQDGIRNWTIMVDWTNPGGAAMMEQPLVPIASFDRIFEGCSFFACVPQPAPGELVSVFQNFTMHRAAMRMFEGFDSVVLSLATDITGGATPNQSGVRWVELRRDTVAGGNWSNYQESTYAPDGDWRWTPSIAMDKTGNTALGYNVSNGTSTEPEIRYTSRQADDPLNMMPGGEVLGWDGTGVQTGSANRWGDYASMTVDPVDDCTFWFTTEYYETTGSFDFNTRTMSFGFQDCKDTIRIFPWEGATNDFWNNQVP